MTQLCTDTEELASSVRAFARGTPAQQRLALGTVPRYFVHLREGESNKFGLSKFCAFANVPLGDYRSKDIYNERSGGFTQNYIRKITGKDWIPLQEAPETSQHEFRLWWETLPNHEAFSTAKFHLLEIHSDDIEKGLPSGGSNIRKMRAISPEQFAKRLLAQDAIGKAGEAIALRYERNRLKNLKVTNPRASVTHVAKQNIAAGYDIESKSSKGGTRFIEVKSTVASADDGFYISAGEITALRELGEKAYIYLVEIHALPNTGRVVAEIPNPAPLLDKVGVLKPQIFRACLKIPKSFRTKG